MLLSSRLSAAPFTSSTLPPDALAVLRVWMPELLGLALGVAQITLMDLRSLVNSSVASFFHLLTGVSRGHQNTSAILMQACTRHPLQMSPPAPLSRPII